MDIMDDNVLTLGIVDAASPRGARGGTHDGHFAFLKGYHVNTQTHGCGGVGHKAVQCPSNPRPCYFVLCLW